MTPFIVEVRGISSIFLNFPPPSFSHAIIIFRMLNLQCVPQHLIFSYFTASCPALWEIFFSTSSSNSIVSYSKFPTLLLNIPYSQILKVIPCFLSIIFYSIISCFKDTIYSYIQRPIKFSC